MRHDTRGFQTDAIHAGEAEHSIVDAPAVTEAAHAAGARTVVDATWLSPYLFRPLEHGADTVIHSALEQAIG